MRSLLHKSMLLLLCLTCLPIGEAESVLPVFAVLFVLLTAELNSYPHTARALRTLRIAANVAYLCACIFYAPFLLLLPILLYDYIQLRTQLLPAAIALAGSSLLLALLYLPKPLLPAWCAIAALAGLLSFHAETIHALEQKLIHVRDTITEQNLLLRTTNHSLLEQRADEVSYAKLQERNRIAAEIHDTVGHLLSRLILQVGAMRTVEQDEIRREELTQLGETLNTAMTSIRNSVHDIHDEAVDVAAQIKEAACIFPSSMTVELSCDRLLTAPNAVKNCLILAAKEAFSNIMRHSNATKVQVSLRENPAFYRLRIHDNGSPSLRPHGDAAAQDALSLSHGIGLDTMKNRVLALGGRFRLNVNDGYEIWITLSCQPNKTEDKQQEQ